jgi:methionyl-tRNA synthetase
MTATYITTTIPYVNARPHIGHALELVQADVLARYRRARGEDVRFQSGTDDNSLKNVLAAGAAGTGVREFVDRNAGAFAALGGALSLTFDDFIRTSRDPRHRPGVERFWRACARDLYRRRYEGLYCTGCEQFYTPAELPGGRCPEHQTVPQQVSEENWFFRLSRYAGPLREAIASGRLRITPAGRRNEVLAFIDAGLEDFSVSRPAARAGGWGIPVPGDPGQVIYVWFDALCNYVTALGPGEEAYRRWWASPGNRIHLLGKGVLRFHAVYWPAMLLSSGQPLPTALFVHDYLTADGRKISKSGSGPAVPDPAELAAVYGADAVRWWLLREVPRVGDADFTVGRLVARADDELANGLGNLVNRVVVMIRRYRDGRVPGAAAAPGGGPLAVACRDANAAAGAALEDFDFRRATAAIWRITDEANAYVNRVRPWELARAGDPRLDGVLAQLLRACSVLGRELAPFLPDLAARVAAQCAPGGDGRLPAPCPVFRRLSAAASGLGVEQAEQDQQDQGTDDRSDDPDRVEAVNAQRVVLDKVLQEAAHERAHDAEHDGAEQPDGVAPRDEEARDGAGDEADDDQNDNEGNHAGKLPRPRLLCVLGRIVMKPAGPAVPKPASSRSSGVRNRGVIRIFRFSGSSPIHSRSRPASAIMAAEASAPTSSSSRTAISPSLRCAQPPTIRPSHQAVGPMFPERSNSAAACPPRYQPRSRQPIAAGSRAGSSAGHGSAAAGASWSAASITPAIPSRSTSASSSWPSACLTCVAVQPAHHCRSAGAAGPKASSQRRASSARAAAASGRGQAGAADQVNCLDVQPPRGRPRTISPSAASSVSSRVVTFTGPP